MHTLKDIAYKHPARIAAFVSSAVALIVAFVNPDIPTEPAVLFILSALGLGEFAQRVEDHKTVVALHTDPEDEDF